VELGICVASHVNEIDYVVRAEELGFSHAWLADSQMLWSDCYATLALAATKTSKIKLGTGVAVAGTRPPAVNAAGIATINALAPGRTFFGIGSGNTAMRVMGLPPQRTKDFGQYLKTIRPLLRGDEAEMVVESGPKAGSSTLIRHIMPDNGFVNFEHDIPMYVSGFGPKSLALAGQYGDGAVIALAVNSDSMDFIWHAVEEGARQGGRELSRENFHTTALTAITVLDEGEAIDSPRVKAECGAMAMASVHYAYDQWRNFGHQPPNALAEIWDDYTAMLEQVPAERRHQRIHAGHNCWVLPEEEKFLTPKVLNSSSLIGTKEQIIEKLTGLARAGLDQVMVLPNFDARYENLERLDKDLIGQI